MYMQINVLSMFYRFWVNQQNQFQLWWWAYFSLIKSIL